MTRIVLIVLLVLSAWPIDESLAENFWEPKLPQEQAFLAYPRSIKSFRLVKYKISFEGEQYPVTELNLEMTHGIVRFQCIEDSKGKSAPTSVKEIAAGDFGEDDSLKKSPPSTQPPDDLKTRDVAGHRQTQFFLDSPEAVEKLHNDLKTLFRLSFPW